MSTMTALAHRAPGTLSIECAREILAACKDVDEAKGIADRAAAIQVWLRAQGAALGAQNDAAEIALRAHRRMGEILRETERARGAAKKRGSPEAPRLDDLGISKKQSAVAQKLADLPDADFDKRIAVVRAGTEKLTQAAIVGKGVKTQSASQQDLRTPRWFFDALVGVFGPFQLDAFAQQHNALCDAFLTKEQNAFTQPWLNQTFANPEFEDMSLPLGKALEEAKRGITTVIVSPVGCSQRWYHEQARLGTIFVPDCRINFDLPDGTPTTSADRDTIVIAIGGQWRNPSKQAEFFKVRALSVKHLAPRSR